MAPEPVHPVSLVYGDAEPIVAWEVSLRVARWGPLAEPASFNRSVFDADDDRAIDAVADARTPPMMASHRLVMVRALDRASEALFTAIDGYLDNPSPDTILLLTGGSFPAARKGGKAWSRRLPARVQACGGEVVEKRARDVSPLAFVVEHARVTLRREVQPQAAELLVATVGDDLMLLARELDKLDVAVPEGQPITRDDVADACAGHAPGQLFEMLDAIVANRPADALGALSLADSDGPEKAFGLLLWKVRSMVAADAVLRAGGGVQQVRAAVGGRPSDAAALVGLLRNHRLDPQLLPRVVAAWVALRARRADPARQLEALVLDLATGAR